MTIHYTAKDIERFWSKVRIVPLHPDACWEWQACDNGRGYGRFGLNGRHGGYITAHRFSYQLHNGAISSKDIVMHQCDNPRCVNPSHLILGTLSDNTRDMVKKGRCNPGRFPGEKNPKAKLTYDDVLNMRILKQKLPTITAKEIAKLFGISYSVTLRILRYELWKNI